MDRIFVDSSAWIALADAGDRNHRAAKRWIASNRLPLVTTNFVFDETVTFVLARLGHGAALRAGESLRSSTLTTSVAVTGADEEAAWALFRRSSDKLWSFTDCTSLIVMKRLGLATAFAFDHDFVKMGLRVVPPAGKRGVSTIRS